MKQKDWATPDAKINNGPSLFPLKKAYINFKGCDSNFAVIIFQFLNSPPLFLIKKGYIYF